jgi:heptosyltransferase-2
VALSTAIMEDLRLAFPDASMHLNTLPAAQALFTADTRFERVLAIDVRARGRRLRQAWRWLRAVRAGRYDLLVDLQASDHTRLLIGLLPMLGCRIRQRLGWRGGFPYTLRNAVHSRELHPIAAMRAMLAGAGIEARTPRPLLRVPPALAAPALDLLERHGLAARHFAVFMPGSQAAGWLKRWGADRYAQLGGLLLDRGVQRIVLIGARDEAEECARIGAAIARSHPGRIVHLDDLHLLQIVSVCARARWIVANDTGIAHIAAAAGRPLVVLCGPTDARRVKPLGPRVRALQARDGCLNCYAKTCRHGDAAQCLARIEPTCVARMLLDGACVATDIAVF